MPTNHTPNYQLSQWERDDRILMDDFNADNAKIDAALKAEADTRTAEVTALMAAVSKLGNCRMDIQSYVGTGVYGADKPSTITFSGKPGFAIVFHRESFAFFTHGAESCPVYCVSMSNTGSGITYVGCTWTVNSVKFYGHTPQCH